MKCNAVQMALSMGQSCEKHGLTAWRIRQHIRSCSACRKAYTELQWLVDHTAQWRTDDPALTLKERIHQALRGVAAPSGPVSYPANGVVNWVVNLKENPKMKRRIGFAGIVMLFAAGGLMTTMQKDASALTRYARMRKAMQNVHTAHLLIWENTMLPGRQFYRREMWVQGDRLRQHIPGKIWLISTSDTNWYYVAEKDSLWRQAHEQKPVAFDFSQTLSEVKGIRKDGQGVSVEMEPDTILQGRKVARIQVTEWTPDEEQLVREQAEEAKAAQYRRETDKLKGRISPDTVVNKAALPVLHSRRSLYWVDKDTNLPLHSENYVEENGEWALEQRIDYMYNEQFAANLFDPQDLLRVGRLETGKLKHPH